MGMRVEMEIGQRDGDEDAESEDMGMERGGQRQLKGGSTAQGCKSRAAGAVLTLLPQGARRWGAGEARLSPETERY